ncbi:MAG: SPOR domain-containing protein, partial [Desulfobacterales bacterium]|nr:SPOR domain-containing protein [Desulfobacterales bacterium]
MIFVQVATGASALKSVLAAVGMLILIAGCGGQSRAPEEPLTPRAKSVLPRMRYTVQAGAFKEIANAVRLTQKLLAQKLFAYHFIDDSGFYKVRIGNFPTREEAIERAERLKAARVLDEYFIIAP